MKHILFLLILAFGVQSIWGKGAPWSTEDQDIIFEKIKYVIKNPNSAFLNYRRNHPGYEVPDYTFKITVQKLLRLGFHDCLKYDDNLEGQINGCDGCLNPKGMNQRYQDENIHATTNNGLTNTADILEEIYTNRKYPSHYNGPPYLDMSMQDKNMSRADLWAFASLVAVSHGVHNNNEGCRSDGCGTLRKNETDCEIEWPRIPNFKTGRSDCIADRDTGKPWYASRPEFHPDPHGNGPMTVDFFKEHFELNAQEAIALVLGAHSFANFHSDISQFRYEWTRKQRGIFNNQMVRHAALKPQYFSDCKSKYFQQYQLTFYAFYTFFDFRPYLDFDW